MQLLYLHKRNAKMIMIPKENFKLLEGSESLSLYQFNTEIAKHFFCKKCGIYTHHNRNLILMAWVLFSCMMTWTPWNSM